MFEGIGKYIFALFVIYVISLIVKKIEMSKIFKKALYKPTDAYIPFVCTKTLIKVSHSSEKLFYQTLIPFLNINAYIKIYQNLLKTFGQNEKDAVKCYFMPMVYLTKLGSGDVKVEIHDYDINNEYLESQEMLYNPVEGEEEKPLYEMTDPGYYVPSEKKEKIVYKVARRNTNLTEVPSENSNSENKTILDLNIPNNVKMENIPEISNEVISENNNLENKTILDLNIPNNVKMENIPEISNEVISPNVKETEINVFENPYEEEVRYSTSEMKNEINNVSGPSTVFTDDTLIPDERMETVVKAVKEEKKEENPIHEAVKGRPKMCPKCGAKLAPSANVCFLCGTHL